MIRITQSLGLAENELVFKFIHGAGPGGQNVNKLATAVQLRFDLAASVSLPDAVKTRLMRLAGKRASASGMLVIDARRFRTQERNRQDAIERLVSLVRKAATPPKPRKATHPTCASKERRLEAKRRRSGLKQRRGPIESLEG